MARSIVRQRASAVKPGVDEALEDAIDRACSSSGSGNSNAFYLALLKRCLEQRALAQGRQLHAHLRDTGLLERSAGDPILASYLVKMYGKCGSVGDAEAVFLSCPRRSAFTWNNMFSAYFSNDLPLKALEIGRAMDLEGVERDAFNLVSSISSCARLGTDFLSQGRQLHQRIGGIDDLVGAALIDMYGKCGSVDEARRVFDSVPTTRMVFWTAMVSAYGIHGRGREAIELYDRFVAVSEEPPDVVMLASVLGACASVAALEDGKRVHARIASLGLDGHTVLGNALVNMYGRCRAVYEARRAFERIDARNTVSWNVIVAANAHDGHRVAAMRLFTLMDLEGFRADGITFVHVLSACSGAEAAIDARRIHRKLELAGLASDPIAASALVSAYGKCGCLREARAVFDAMGEERKNAVAMTAMLAAYAQRGQGWAALDIYKRMDRLGAKVDCLTFTSALDACSAVGALAEGRAIHDRILAAGLAISTDVALCTALLNMYARSGDLASAKALFDAMEERSVITWNALMGSYAQWGLGREALELYHAMDAPPNSISFVAALSACAAVGALLQGRAIHSRLAPAGFDREPEVGVALVNMYAKCGSLDDALGTFWALETKNVVSWTVAVAGLAQHGRYPAAVRLFREMELHGVTPDGAALVPALFACSHGGMLRDGRNYLVNMAADYGVSPAVVHYDCVVDLLCRTGLGAWAEELVDTMPFEPTAVTWTTLLSACRARSASYERAKRAAAAVLEKEPDSPGVYFALSYMYSGVRTYRQDMLNVADKLQSVARRVGRCYIETKSQIHEFVEGETAHQFEAAIAEELNRLNIELTIERGCKVEEKNHSAKRAVVLGLVATLPGTVIRVVKNLKLCADCHHAIKVFSKVRGRSIIVRDYTEFHHIENGVCSCDSRKPALGVGLDCLVASPTHIPGVLW